MGNQLANINKIEKDLGEAADNLRANSKPTSTEYCMPVLGSSKNQPQKKIIFGAKITHPLPVETKSSMASSVSCPSRGPW